MKKKIINGILAAAILVAAPSAFVSCKDNDADLRTELLGKIADLRNRLDGIQAQKGDKGDTGAAGKDGSVVTIQEVDGVKYWFIDGKNTGVPAQVKGDKGEKGEKGDAGENANVVEIGENGNWFINGKDTGIPAKGQNGKDGKDGTSIITIGENGNWFLDGKDSGVPATGPAGADGANGKNGVTPVLVKGDDGHWYWWINGEYTGVRADGDGATIEGDKWTVGPAGTWLINGTDTGILAYNYDQMVKLIKDQIYNAERDGLTPELEDIIKKLLNNLEDALQKSVEDMVTDVIAERTENSLYGQLSIPGWNPLILSAYYGEAKTDVIFPAPAINIKNVDTSDSSLDAGQEIKGDGGKLYLTLNPAEVPTEGKMLSLETSAGKEAPFTLGELTEYTGELTFGWNRTRGANGLYEVSAELKDAKAAGINVNSDILKSDAKKVLNDLRDGAERNAVKALATFMADAFTGAIETMPAYTAKVAWNDPLFGPRSVRGGYNIAAFSIQPLAYDFEYSTTLDSKPYIDRVQNFIDKVIDKVNINLSLGLGTINKITIDNIDLAGKTVTVNIPAQETVDAGGVGTGHYVAAQTLTINMDDALVPVATEMNNAFDKIEELNDFIEKVNNIDANINNEIVSSKNALKAQIHDYLGVLTNKINDVLGKLTVNKIIQPTLLVKASDGVHRAHGSFKGEISLLPTSYSAELLAPAYKKFVVITKVDGADATAADNPGQLGEVLDGGVQEVKFTPAAGKTYTVVYSAMDYFGNVVTNEYIIKGE